MKYQHIPVMPEEAIEFLNLKNEGTYVDCTLGGGGHSLKLKDQNSKLKIVGIDRDKEALAAAKELLAKFKHIQYVQDSFLNLKNIVKEPVDGFLFDLGISSYQIDEAARGFSLQKDGPLDMRMNQDQPLSAEQLVNLASIEDLTKIFKDFGEERFARRIANAIGRMRQQTPISTTQHLKEIVEKAIPSWKKRESVTRIFQALRIAVNRELESLEIALKDAINLLKPQGRIVVISYHSLEDRIAKHTFRSYKQAGQLKVLTKKPLRATEKEISLNPRARSAKLRAAEKL